jgi:predicted dehydrogenase
MIGLIGCGFWGPNFARIATECNKLKWAADLDSAQLQKIKDKFPELKTTSDFNEILADSEVNAVIIATPANTHYTIAKAALSAGKHVLVEKPITTTTKDCEELIKIADEKKKILMVGHTFLYNAFIKTLKDYLTKKDLGEVYYLYSTRVNLGQIRGDVNAMWNLAPHDISITNYLADGQPKSVRAEGKTYINEGNQDVVFINLEYPNNVMAQIHVSWLDPNKIRQLVVVGSKKMAVFDDLGKDKLQILDKGVMETEDLRYSPKEKFKLRYGDVEIPKIEEPEPLKNEFNHFLDCIENNKKPLTDGQAGLSVVKVLEAAQESLDKNGERIEIK